MHRIDVMHEVHVLHVVRGIYEDLGDSQETLMFVAILVNQSS